MKQKKRFDVNFCVVAVDLMMILLTQSICFLSKRLNKVVGRVHFFENSIEDGIRIILKI